MPGFWHPLRRALHSGGLRMPPLNWQAAWLSFAEAETSSGRHHLVVSRQFGCEGWTTQSLQFMNYPQ